MALNRIDLMGRLVRDVELRQTNNGKPVASFTIAVDRDRKNQNGEKETDFFDIVAWNSTAEFASKYFVKGRMAIVSGRLQNREWTDKDGNKRRTAEIVADNLYFGDSKPNSESSGFATQEYSAPAQAAPGNFAVVDDNSELPF